MGIIKEIWADIHGYETLYQVSTLGRIKSLSNEKRKKEKILILYTTDRGYVEVCLSKNNFKKSYRVNRIVAQAFLENPYHKAHVNHKNGVRNDNRVENLEWATPTENMIHSFAVLKRVGANFGLRGVLNLRSQKIKQINPKDNSVVNIFYGCSEAQRETGILASHICQVANKNTVRKTAGKFKWEWVKNEL